MFRSFSDPLRTGNIYLPSELRRGTNLSALKVISGKDLALSLAYLLHSPRQAKAVVRASGVQQNERERECTCVLKRERVRGCNS